MEQGIEEHLISARKSLSSNLEKSKALGLSLQKAGPRFAEISQQSQSLEAPIIPIKAQKDALSAVAGHINRAVVPATTVLKVSDDIHGLDKFLSNPQLDLVGYLGVVKMLEEALRFLEENCEMGIQWLADIMEYLETTGLGMTGLFPNTPEEYE